MCTQITFLQDDNEVGNYDKLVSNLCSRKGIGAVLVDDAFLLGEKDPNKPTPLMLKLVRMVGKKLKEQCLHKRGFEQARTHG